MQIEKLIKKHIQVWDSKVMAIPYASKQYKEHLKQFIDGLIEWEEDRYVRETRVEDDNFNRAKQDSVSHLKEIRKQLE